ncbi:MAG TPA: aminoacetone oxidase family FAD-binding enzyme [Vicinamibacterales bacterium]|nr:aminoacetone oxidase family FAD-binding enzyme [Vicinamibacterales bacterium]
MDDLVIIGAGAAGLATAIFAARTAPRMSIRCVDGARHLGAKILVSGGSRCNVTNRAVSERDFWGGSSRIVRNVLRAFPAARAIEFFAGIGVTLHEEEDGKLFPDTNRSRSVLDALLAEAARLQVVVQSGHRVTSLSRDHDRFRVGIAGRDEIDARAVVLATGGQSLPKTGSDGFGYQLARTLGHRIVQTTPALAPLLLDDDWHVALSGVAHPAAATLQIDGHDDDGRTRRARVLRLQGDWLWTHFGASGPLALNLSRHWHRAMLDGGANVSLSVLPGETFESLETWLLAQERGRPRARVATVLATRLPASVANVWAEIAGVDADTTLAHVTRDERRRLAHALTTLPLIVRGSRGYQFAEATAGGVSLDEIDSATLESRCCPSLYLVGEILDVDGRLGGFNFQWAWSSGFVAGQSVAKRLGEFRGIHTEV